ncbi:MAG: hypothetical protein A2096_12670 [Spirochaetes bacterium GWF1_41_5]|nr:MAG: hypothetical protein A2096_12670 [Spirochaetes bacterium GWF1_41_5]HBE01782.1 hypothetical protein [Spirochaetia bacterium]
MDWRRVTIAHFRICEWSSPHRIINYDFIGGNDPLLSEDKYREHGELFRKKAARGYACLGLLPGHFSLETQNWLKELIKNIHPAK